MRSARMATTSVAIGTRSTGRLCCCARRGRPFAAGRRRWLIAKPIHHPESCPRFGFQLGQLRICAIRADPPRRRCAADGGHPLQADGGHLGFAFIGTVGAQGPGKRILEILDPYLSDQPAHDAFRVAQRLSRARHEPQHLVYTPLQDRSKATAQLWMVLHPRELIVLRSDEVSLAGIIPGTGRHTENGGVELTIHSAAPS